MKTRNNIMILDTETVGTFGQPLIHDLGYVIVDKDFNILRKDRFLVKELHVLGKWILKTSDFYQEYAKDYYTARKEEKILAWSEIASEMVKVIRQYKVTTISAYNLQFDYKAIKYTEELFNNSKRQFAKTLDLKSKALLCIYHLAECAYRYITKNTEYDEKHTALSASMDEKEILEYICKNTKQKKLEYGLFYNCWRKVQR